MEPIKKNKKLLNVAKILRSNMTPQENHLWYDFLRHYPIKVYKQRIIGNFIVDFYCHKALVVIELDGAQHYTNLGKSHDEARSKILKQYGLYILRFSNRDIDEKFDAVCRQIDKTITDRIFELSPQPCNN